MKHHLADQSRRDPEGYRRPTGSLVTVIAQVLEAVLEAPPGGQPFGESNAVLLADVFAAA